MSPCGLQNQPTFTLLADGTGYCILRRGRVSCVCVDLPSHCDTMFGPQRQALRERFFFAWRHARLRK